MKGDMKRTTLAQWEKHTNQISKIFIDKYFGKDATEVWWIMGEIGGILVINDYYFDIQDIVTALRENTSKKKLFEVYDKRLKEFSNP